LEFWDINNGYRADLEVLSFGAYDNNGNKSYGNYWKFISSSQSQYFQHYIDFSAFEIYRFSKLKYGWPVYQVSVQRQFKLLEPGIYNALDIFESPNCTSHAINWGLPSSNEFKVTTAANNTLSNSQANSQIKFTIDHNATATDWATSGIAILVYAIILLVLTRTLMLYKKGSFSSKKIYDNEVMAISKIEKTEKYELLEQV
jgi:hypothetical protein